MTDRQAFALAHPLGDRGLGLEQVQLYRRTREHPRGLLTTVLAIDR